MNGACGPGNKYTRDQPDKEENPDKDNEDAELEKEEKCDPKTSPKPKTTLQRKERPAEEKKRPVEVKEKPLEEKKTAEEKGKLAEGKTYPYSEMFVPRLGGQLIPDDYALSGAVEQNVWWALNVAEKVNRLKAREEEAASRIEKAENNYKKVAARNAKLEKWLKEAAMMPISEPKKLREAIQDRIKTCNQVEDLELQLSKEEKNLKKAEERLKDVEKDRVWQRSQKIVVEKMLEEEKRRTNWRDKALSRLEEANTMVKKLTKLDVPGIIQTNTIDKFFEKGSVNYKPIFDALSKFTNDVEKALSEFQESL